ncbi:Zn-dependent protease with chaperone function [Arsukibacterium tuosuense]|uniref:Zn-dependent protease with chaperone function n=1 Tax=Arsukibacterium tuosuense TaxID=1323745 RepID=A0A285JAY9_9GAMM|nr:M48 family metallopeptidase [Arsukibacterium tuosuense]SNY57263.1 Zn-dependent protease with chaperone function [Arsukibacterium tuosuense]
MATNFFSQQDLARRNTRILVSLFSLAVILLLLLTNALVLVGLGLVDLQNVDSPAAIEHGLPWPTVFFISSAVIVAVGIAVLIKWQQLKGGGKVVATSLGGSRIDAASDDPLERRLLNVVEEMAIAANVPVPPVYLLPEKGINAFAAGYSPGDAVIGVTRGCIEQLNRDELQGVVAHEFSHILNGDMRMNIRMIAILNGILFLGHIGYYMLRSGSTTRGSISRSSSGKNKNAGGILAIALGLVVIGYLGSFFGNLIKAAVSRQREYLADASAVQFSRNPRGIAGALKRIGAHSAGTRINNQNADENSHLFFGEAISRWASIFATHPPLNQRIKRLEPHWNGKFPSPVSQVEVVTEPTEAKPASSTMPDKQTIMQAMAALPMLLVQNSRQPLQAQAIVCALLLQHPDYEAEQIKLIKEQGSLELLQQVDQLVDAVQALSLPLQVQLLQRTVPALKELSNDQFLKFERLLTALTAADKQLSLPEWIIINFIDHTVASHFKPKQQISGARQADFATLQTPATQLLAAVARAAGEPETCRQAWLAGLNTLGLAETTAMPASNLPDLTHHLDRLLSAAPLVKQKIWQAILAAVAADNLQTDSEQALLTALALLLEMPWQPEVAAV